MNVSGKAERVQLSEIEVVANRGEFRSDFK
jgi:hypothetical protein